MQSPLQRPVPVDLSLLRSGAKSVSATVLPECSCYSQACFVCCPCQPAAPGAPVASLPVGSAPVARPAPSDQSRFEYYPFERSVVQYEDRQVVERVPVEEQVVEYETVRKKVKRQKERLVEDYCMVEKVTEFRVEFEREEKLEYVDKKVHSTRLEYVPVQHKIVHYPAGVPRDYIDSITNSGVIPLSEEQVAKIRAGRESQVSPVSASQVRPAQVLASDSVYRRPPLAQPAESNYTSLHESFSPIRWVAEEERKEESSAPGSNLFRLKPLTQLKRELNVVSNRQSQPGFWQPNMQPRLEEKKDERVSRSSILSRSSKVIIDGKASKFDFSGPNQFTVIFQSKKTGALIEVAGGKRAEGLAVGLSKAGATGTSCQRWRLKKVGQFYQIQNAETKLVVDCKDIPLGKQPFQSPGFGEDSQLWELVAEEEAKLIRSKARPEVVLAAGEAGRLVLQQFAGGRVEQQWQFFGFKLQ